jgi:molybdate transport system substrate-binding protein
VFTYAIGQIVLYSAAGDVTDGAKALRDGSFQHVAIANPETAPYGRAAVQALKSLGLYDAIQPKIVQGQNIGQTYQFIETGNAELGFVALGQIRRADAASSWVVPQDLYEPIRQDAVLLKAGEENPAARAFLEFLRSPEATTIIEKYGYALDR